MVIGTLWSCETLSLLTAVIGILLLTGLTHPALRAPLRGGEVATILVIQRYLFLGLLQL
jgi:hypothetical protein